MRTVAEHQHCSFGESHTTAQDDERVVEFLHHIGMLDEDTLTGISVGLWNLRTYLRTPRPR